MTSPPYSVEAVTADGDVVRLEADWDRLSRGAAAPNVFTTYDWYQAWNRAFGCSEDAARLQPCVLTLRERGEVAGIAPLIRVTSRRRGIPFRRLQFALHDEEWDYNDLIVGGDAPDKVKAVTDYLARSAKDWEIVDLENLRADDGQVEAICGALKRAGLPHVVYPAAERCPFMRIDGDWEQMLSRRSSATRHTLRNRQSRMRRATGDGLRMRIVEDPRTEAGLLERMVALEAQKHVGGKQSAPFLGPHRDVFATLFDRLGPKGWLCVALLEWDDRLLSWHLLFRCGQSLWGYMTAYEHEFAKLSPGSVLVPTIIDYGFERGYTEYDFLSGEEPYKAQWTAAYHERKRIVIWNGRLKSRLFAAAYKRMRAAAAEQGDGSRDAAQLAEQVAEQGGERGGN